MQAWYLRDENAVPPVYLLQSRRQQFTDAKDYTQDAPWNEVQAILWEIINRAHPPEQLRGRFDAAALAEGSPPAIVRFQTSATEQEILHGAMRVPDAREHVLAFFRQIENVGEFSQPKQIENFVDLECSANSWKVDKALWDEQERLKEALKPRLGEKNIFAGSARLVPARDAQGQSTADVTTDHLAKLCADVESRLTEIIKGQFEEYWNKTAQASTERAARELKIEQDEHARFSSERGGADSFVGRESELQAIRDYLQKDSPWPLVIHGASGCGKTALLARAAEEIQKSEVSGQKAEVIVRFIGVTPRSSDIRSLLGSLCQDLRLRHPREGELPADSKSLGEELQEHLRSATPEQPIILFLDALDQLSDADNGRLLNWIPAGPLPDNVKFVVSCLSDRVKGDPAGQPFTELTRRQLIPKNSINLDALSEAEARTLLFDRWLPQAGRTVSRDQRERIGQLMASVECRQPIYLKLLFEEARFWQSYDAAPCLGESVPAILGQLIERLGQPANHGRLLVERVLGYLAASRHGLAENEILEILFADPEYKAKLNEDNKRNLHELPASATRIPIAIWSRLRFDLAPYLTERAAPGANVLTFYHRQVAEWVQEHFVKASEHSWQPHRRLADYFTACAKGTAEEWETDNVRGFAECVFQLINAGQHELAAGFLSNFPFLLHKLRVGLLEGVFEDYELIRKSASANTVLQLDIWSSFFREKAHILRRGNDEWPSHKILHQLAIEHADDSPITIAAERWLAEGRCDWLWLRRIPRLQHTSKSPCLAVFEGHSNPVWGAALSDGRILSWSEDKTLRLWDTQNGQCLTVLVGHAERVRGALPLADGRILSWSEDKTLRMWNAQNGQCLAVFKGHTSSVRNALLLAGNKILSTGTEDKDLRVWNMQNSQCVVVLNGHHHGVDGAQTLPDGRILSWANDDVRLWDAQTGECLAVLKGHSGGIFGALALSDGRILSWSGDSSLRLWDSRNGQCLAVLKGHSDWVTGALALSDGRILSWSSDATLRLWDAQRGKCLAVLAAGHTNSVKAALALSDGKIVSWVEGDKNLWLWDAQTGECLAELTGHTECIEGALPLAEGRIVSWSADSTLRVWNTQNCHCLVVLNGHSNSVIGARTLLDGKILSWSYDNTIRLWNWQCGQFIGKLEGHPSQVEGVFSLSTDKILTWAANSYSFYGSQTYERSCTLRLWDPQTGQCLAALEGKFRRIYGALAISDRRILFLSDENTMRLWDVQAEQCSDVVSEDQASGANPEMLRALGKFSDSDSICGDYFADLKSRSVRLRNKNISNILAVWNADSHTCSKLLSSDGTAMVTQWNGQVCILKLYHGNRRVSLAEVEGILASHKKKAK